MSDENRRADRAYIARLRWRAGLHRLNVDDPGARLNEQHADVLQRLYDARLAVDANPDDAVAEQTLRGAKAAIRADRQAWRTVRDAFHPGIQIAAGDPTDKVAGTGVLNNFAEPSDDELLGGAA